MVRRESERSPNESERIHFARHKPYKAVRTESERNPNRFIALGKNNIGQSELSPNGVRAESEDSEWLNFPWQKPSRAVRAEFEGSPKNPNGLISIGKSDIRQSERNPN